MTKTPIIAAAFFAVSTLTATAGGLAEPIMEPEIIVQDVTTSSNDGSGLLQWMILAGIIVLATAN